MSLDNVIAVAGAAAGDLGLVLFGIGLSIPIVVFASGALAALMNRYGWIVLLAGGVLGEVAGKMLIHDQFLVHRVGVAPAGSRPSCVSRSRSVSSRSATWRRASTR